MLKNERFLAWLAFACVAFFWGTTFLVIRIGVESFPPLLLAGFRHSIGGIILCGWFWLKGYKLPAWSELRSCIINGTLMLTLGNGLVTWAEKYVSSGLAAIICSLTPLWVIGINVFSGRRELFNLQVLAGLVLCIVAQLIIFHDHLAELADTNYLLGILAVLAANIAWAFSTVYYKGKATVLHPAYAAGLQMLAGGFLLDLLGTFTGEWSRLHPSWQGLAALGYLVLFGSIIAYVAYMYVLKKLPATLVSMYAYINTIVAVILGWLWLHETLNLSVISGVILTIGGVFLVNKSFSQ